MAYITGESAGSNVEALLATVTGVDVNQSNKVTLYNVPSGKTMIPLRIIVRNASVNLTTAEFGFGFNANADDVVPSIIHTQLTSSSLFIIDNPVPGAAIGSAASVFGLKCTITQGAAATVTVDVFGYLV